MAVLLAWAVAAACGRRLLLLPGQEGRQRWRQRRRGQALQGCWEGCRPVLPGRRRWCWRRHTRSRRHPGNCAAASCREQAHAAAHPAAHRHAAQPATHVCSSRRHRPPTALWREWRSWRRLPRGRRWRGSRWAVPLDCCWRGRVAAHVLQEGGGQLSGGRGGREAAGRRRGTRPAVALHGGSYTSRVLSHLAQLQRAETPDEAGACQQRVTSARR